MIEHKGIGYEPINERTQVTNDLHEIFLFNTDYEITSCKKSKEILILLKKVNNTLF